MLSPHLSYTLHLTISVSLFLQLVFQWNDVYIFGMILFDACPDCINVIRMDQKRHPAGCFAVSVTWGRCNPVRKTLRIQKLMEHHALCVIVKENIIADMFIFFFHFTDSASPQMHRFLYEAVQHLYRCNLFPERVPEYFSPSVLLKLQAFLCRTGSRTSDCSR